MGPLLETRIHPPRGRAGLMERARLLERLDDARDARVVLVPAPAGFGKTTLVTQWLAHQQRTAAWLSVDDRDDVPAVFWRYVVAALRTAAPDVGTGALRELDADHGSVEAALASLVNDLHALTDDVVLVVDDLHLVGSPEGHGGMTFLVEHLPARLQLVLSGRADPRLPLARLRARGELAEVRAADRRFTAAEAAGYLTGTMGLPLAAPDVTTLESRTEGWIVALQLAALSLRDRPDASAFITQFAGDDRYVVDFLVEEVLDRQPHDVRSFLLHTSVLRSLTGPLCDAVTGRQGSRALLDLAERANLFVVPLDGRRRWYRYHHLFGEVLHARLLDEEPELVPQLHRRAAAWLEGTPLRGAGDMHVATSRVLREQGDLDGALHHLVVSRDLGEHVGLPQHPYRWRVAMAQLRHADGDHDGALALLTEAERVHVGDFAPDVRPVAATRARVQLASGDLGGALGWVRRHGLAPDDALSPLQEYAHVTLARVLLAQHAAERDARHLADATTLLRRLLRAAREGGRHGTALEVRVLLARASQVAGDGAAARAALTDAVAVAEPEGHVAAFADEGPALAGLLRDLRATSGDARGSRYVRGLVEVCESRATGRARVPARTPAGRPSGAGAPVEPLTDRELEVLRLLTGDLDGPAIARELVVSVHTVRTHTKNIYAKLGVTHRRAAVRRAAELRLVPGAPDHPQDPHTW